MKLGLLQFDLHITDASSLKDKRRVVQSLKSRLRQEHNISIAEIAAQDKWNVATLGVAAVSADTKHLSGLLDAVIRKLDALHDAQLGSLHRSIQTLDTAVIAGSPDPFASDRPVWSEDDKQQAAQLADALSHNSKTTNQE